MGFNMLRKHVKVESQRLYTWADRLGLLVWQDMPSSGADRGKIDPNALAEADRQWDRELQAMIDNLHNHPCIVTWVPFNEGWGQHDTQRVTAWVKGYDPTRLVNNASGWTDEAVGDVRDIHEYPGPAIPPLEDARAAVLGEFGGLGLPVKGHLWKDEGNWGYRSFEDLEAFRQRYTHLIADLYGLVGQGLAAAVYTQTTDCEVEVNGLMTYDRRVCKLDPKVFSSLNRGYLPPRIQADRETFIEPMQAVLQQADPQAQIRYTLDGSDPTRRSRPYSGPIQIHLDTVLKARAFWPDGTVSVPVTGRFKRAGAALPAVETPGSQPGLSVQTFEGQWAELPDFSSLAPVRTGVANRIDLDAAAGATSRFALRFSGYLRVPETDVYAFFLSSDDGARLRISGQDVATHDGVHGMSEVKGEIALQAGWHPIELAYFQADGGMGLQVLVSGPGLARDPIPAQGLCH